MARPSLFLSRLLRLSLLRCRRALHASSCLLLRLPFWLRDPLLLSLAVLLLSLTVVAAFVGTTVTPLTITAGG